MADNLFHAAVSTWFARVYGQPTPAQARAWPVIKQDRHTLISAPTGSGKTLAAFLSTIDDLVRWGVERGLKDEVYVLYVSPLKALSNDINKNLEEPLSGITRILSESLTGENTGLFPDDIDQGKPLIEIRSAVRTGDTTQTERNRMRQVPPHILVTTPESLFILLTSDSGRRMLSTVRTVIVDEIHALADNKRGSHLALSLERLEALTERHPTRIGLSATQKPLTDIAHYLVGKRDEPCEIVDVGYTRDRDLAIELPDIPLGPLMPEEGWRGIYDRLAQIAKENTTTLVFVNTRRLAERAARHMAERLGEDRVTAHHGSLAREHRLNSEQRLKNGELKMLIATSSLELGIDIGDVSCVCQLGSPRSIAALLQRVGRSGHQVGGTPKGRLFPQSRDDLVECVALLDAIRRGELDKIEVAEAHLDVLCQQVIAEVGEEEWNEDELYDHLTRAWPYRNLPKEKFTECLIMLAEGFTTKRGRRSRYIFRDAVNKQLKPRPGAKLTAITNGGAIPDQFDYNVVLEPEGLFIGTLNEDFAFESLPGDIVQLGNTSYRILKVEQGKVRVEDARGQPPTMPFWFGEAPGRTDELSAAVSRLRTNINEKLKNGIEATVTWLMNELNGEKGGDPLSHHPAVGELNRDPVPSGHHSAAAQRNPESTQKTALPSVQETALPTVQEALIPSVRETLIPSVQETVIPSVVEGSLERSFDSLRSLRMRETAGESSETDTPRQRRIIESHIARQLVDYLAATKNALGTIPTQHDIVFERFFDEAGDQHLVIHSPYGSRINRAWGLALRKRFCRQFNFELQAAALEDTIVLSLGPTHSFPLDEVTHYLNSRSVRDILIQALCAAPVFMTRWRWVASIALALRRNNAGRRIPAQFQRMDAEDLMAVVFPDQLACAENLTGEREVPEHPLVEQTLHDCLHEVMDIDGLIQLLHKMEQDEVAVHCRDLNGPSPLAQEILFARPYAFLDDAPAEERRTQAVNARRFMDPADAADLAGLDPEAIKKVAAEAWPDMNTPDELHDALMVLGFITAEEYDRYNSGGQSKDPSTALGMTAGSEAAKDAVIPSELFGSAQGGFRESNPSVILSERSESKDLENDSSFQGKRISPSSLAGEGRIDGSFLDTLESNTEESDTDSPDASSPSTSYWRTPVSSRLIDSLIEERRATILHTKQKTIISCAERLLLVQSVFQNATMQPAINAAGPATTRDWPTHEALVELLRARLEGTGIISESHLLLLFECTPHQLQAALMVLENEGYAMRGNFTGSGEQEWCERGLLARIHRYTIKSLRNVIQAVSAADYMRFLFDWHGMTDRPEGDAAVLSAIDKLEGFPLPAGVWETDILPARIKGYLTTSLDHLCSAGHVVWARLNAKPKSRDESARASKAGLLRNTPITLLDRYNVDYWRALQPQQDGNDLNLHANAATVLGVLKQHGASFFVDIVRHSGLLRTHAEEALAELAALGVVTSDSFAGLRALITPANKKPGFDRMRRRRPAVAAARGIDDAGRWSIIANTPPAGDEKPVQGWIETDRDTLNHIAWTLLKRYGVVFHRVLERESGLPPWRELLYAWRRMEARGEIRGGRFVEGFSGEQFAMPEAVTLLRKHRNGGQKLPPIVISATDPLNLVGIALPGERIPAIHTNRILFQDGLPVAKQLNGEVHFFGEPGTQDQWEINFLLTRKKNPAGFVQEMAYYKN